MEERLHSFITAALECCSWTIWDPVRGKRPPVTIEWEVGRTPEPIDTLRGRKENVVLLEF